MGIKLYAITVISYQYVYELLLSTCMKSFKSDA